MELKQIDTKDTYLIRNQVLRPGLPENTCYFNGDDEEMTFHLGAYEEDMLASIASFYFSEHDKIEAEHQYQLRGMATLDRFRGKGMSRKLLEVAFPMIKNNHVNTVWCNARVGALGFYQKMGFEQIGDFFDIEGIGQHALMSKIID